MNVSNHSTINKWWESEVYLAKKHPSLIFWNSLKIFSTPDDFILICILNVYTFIILVCQSVFILSLIIICNFIKQKPASLFQFSFFFFFSFFEKNMHVIQIKEEDVEKRGTVGTYMNTSCLLTNRATKHNKYVVDKKIRAF